MYPDNFFHIFGNGVNFYGLFFAIGVISALVLFLFYSKKKGMDNKAQNTFYFIGIAAIVIGYLSSMLFQSFYNYLESGEFKLFTGITFLGGLIGGVIGIFGGFFLFGRKYKKEFWLLLQIAPCCVTLAHAFGRIGCLFAGCCHGRITEKWYGIFMSPSGGLATYYVPTQLFEALILFGLCALLSWLLFKKPELNLNISIYLVVYGIWRFLIEFARDDYRGEFIGSLTPSQFWCIVMVVIGIGLVITKYVLKEKKEIDLWV